MNEILTPPDHLKQDSNNQYFPALTGIRAISAWCVFFHHFNYTPKGVIHDFIDGLHIGVTIFFVLSGFLIAYRYYDNGPVIFRKYFINRVARIYPMYFLLTTITFAYTAIIAPLPNYHYLKLFLVNITFLRGFFDSLKFTGIGPGWSLTVEETFYLLAPLFFLLIKRDRKFLIGLPVACIITGIILVNASHLLQAGSFFGSYFFMFAYTFFGRAIEFFIGITLALFFKKYSHRYQTKWATFSGLLAIAACLIGFIYLKRHTSYAYGVEHPAGLFINNVILPISGIAVLFWGLLTEQTWLRKLLETKPLVLLGKSSYIFYLIHLGIFYTILSNYTSSILLIFILLNVLSVILYHFVEEPANKLLRKLAFSGFIRQPAIVQSI